MPSKQEIVMKALIAGLEVQIGDITYRVFKKGDSVLMAKGLVKMDMPLSICSTHDKGPGDFKKFAYSNMTMDNFLIRCELLITEDMIVDLLAKLARGQDV